MNCAEVSGKLEAFFFSRRAHLLTTSSSQSPLTSVSAFGENCGRSLAPPLPTKQALRGPLSAVVFPAETVRSARRMRLLREPMDNATALRSCCHCPRRMQPFPVWKQLQSCLRKPATGSFVAEMDSAPALSIFSFAKEKQKNRG